MNRKTKVYIFPLIVALIYLYNLQNAYSAEYFVDQSHSKANDVNAGTRELPLRTITAAAARVKAGDTVLIAAGTYREMIFLKDKGGTAKQPIAFRALPGAEVFIKGSDPVSGWVPYNQGIWKRPGWGINSQQVFVDGHPLQQIGETCPLSSQRFENKPLLPPVGKGLKDMQPGTFFYGEKDKTLFIRLKDDSDPNDHLVEVSARDFIIPPLELNYINLEKINFAHSNLTSKGLIMGMVNVWGNFWTITDCTFNFADFAGISIIGEGHTITNCNFNNNGNLGISINGSDEAHKWAPVPNRPPQNITISGNETSYNNYRKFELHWQHGGIKAAVSCKEIRVSRHRAFANFGAGIWFDAYCKNVTIENSLIKENLVGIAYEISDDALIFGNLVLGSKYHGIYVSSSNRVKIFNNTLDANGFGIVLHGMPRSEHPTLQHNTIRNNIISQSTVVDLVIYDDPKTTLKNSSDYNLFFSKDKILKLSWSKSTGYDITHTNLEAFSKATGQEIHSLNGDPLWKNKEFGDYRLSLGSPAIDSGFTPIEGIGDKDLHGLNRVVDGDGNGTPEIDIGAYEYYPKYGLPAPN